MTFLLAFLALTGVLWLLFFAIGPALERLLAKSAHFTSKFRYRDYLPVVVVLALGIAAATAAGDAFLDIAEELQRESAELTEIDSSVHSWARYTRETGATAFFTAMTVIGTPAGLGILVLLVVIALAMRRRFRWAGYLIFTTGVGGLLNLQLKAMFARARPELAEALRDAHGYSFPSGHAMGSTIVFGALAYVAFRVLGRWRYRALAFAFATSMVVAISASRIYLGVHWISDVGAGICAGAIWFVATTVGYESFRRIRLVRSLRAKAEASGQLASSARTSRGE